MAISPLNQGAEAWVQVGMGHLVGVQSTLAELSRRIGTEQPPSAQGLTLHANGIQGFLPSERKGAIALLSQAMAPLPAHERIGLVQALAIALPHVPGAHLKEAFKTVMDAARELPTSQPGVLDLRQGLAQQHPELAAEWLEARAGKRAR